MIWSSQKNILWIYFRSKYCCLEHKGLILYVQYLVIVFSTYKLQIKCRNWSFVVQLFLLLRKVLRIIFNNSTAQINWCTFPIWIICGQKSSFANVIFVDVGYFKIPQLHISYAKSVKTSRPLLFTCTNTTATSHVS